VEFSNSSLFTAITILRNAVNNEFGTNSKTGVMIQSVKLKRKKSLNLYHIYILYVQLNIYAWFLMKIQKLFLKSSVLYLNCQTLQHKTIINQLSMPLVASA
jgi:hypothetical protein